MRRFRSRLLVGGLLAGFTGVLGSTLGCFPNQTAKPVQTNRGQMDDDPEKEIYATIGAKTEIGNADPIPVSGVGLVYGLRGTGSSANADGWRQMLETSLKKRQLDTKLLLDNPEKKTSLVLVSATIPPGSRTGEKLDVLVSLPQGSRTTSLQHGVLDLCTLSNYEMAGQARQQLASQEIPVGRVPLAAAGTMILGSKLAVAEGPLVAGAIVSTKPVKPTDLTTEPSETGTETVEAAAQKVAKIWGGATCQIDRPYYFLLTRNTPQPQLAMKIASRLNSIFNSGDRSGKIAEAKVEGGKPMVTVFVPPAYRHNHERFLMVARNVTLTNSTPGDPYRKKLEQDLQKPELAIETAIKLEALGTDGAEILAGGLMDKSPWVRFASAQSLAYLGKADPTAATVLGELAKNHPALRTHCLLALASQDDAPCVDTLLELMKSNDPHLRYGAFTALRTADENHDSIRGRRLGNSYWLHQVVSESDGLVHLTTERRNEITLFGNGWPLRGPFSFPLGTEFTVSMKEGSTAVTITRLSTQRDKEDNLTTVTGQHRADLAEVLKGLAALGGSYSEAIEFIRRASTADVLGAKLAVDATPRSYAVNDLVRIARVDPMITKADEAAIKLKDGQDIVQASATLPTEGEAVKAKPVVQEPALNRNPGSVFRPFHAENIGPQLNRNPGSLFSGKGSN